MIFLHGCYRELAGSVCVSDDNFGGGYMLARHLITRGHTRIAGIFKSDDIQGHQRKPLENLPLLVRRVPGGKEHGGVVALGEKLLHVLEDGGEDVVVNIGGHDGDAAAAPDQRLRQHPGAAALPLFNEACPKEYTRDFLKFVFFPASASDSHSFGIIIRTEGCGICTSDLKCLHGAPQYWGDGNQPA